MIHWVSTHPIATGAIFIAVTAWALAFIWLIRDTNREADRIDEWTKPRIHPHRDLPPRSPERKKRGW